MAFQIKDDKNKLDKEQSKRVQNLVAKFLTDCYEKAQNQVGIMECNLKTGEMQELAKKIIIGD